METWLPRTGRITGDMRSDAVWQALLEILVTRWLDKEGNVYRPVLCALDIQGDYYPECLEFIRTHGFRLRLRAVRGYSPARGLAAGRSFGILRNRYTDKTTGVLVQNVDVDIAKTQLANMLARRDPGPGYVHLPCGPNGEVKGGWDSETVAELTAEYRRQTNLRGYTVSRWYKRSGRPNHRLDCLVYALAGLAISRLKIDACELQRVEVRNVGKPDERENHERSPFGARSMVQGLGIGEPAIGTVTGFRTGNRPKKTGFGTLPGSGFKF
jgi:phage terminase large subunit GpA-like protein